MKVYYVKVITFLGILVHQLDNSLCENGPNSIQDEDNKRTRIENEKSFNCVKDKNSCRCEEHPDIFGKILKCNKAGLISFPTTIDKKQDIVKIEMNENKISELTSEAFEGFHNLTELYVSNNEIKTIENQIFQRLNKLVILDLHRNKMVTLKAGMFENAKNLTQLSLAENEIKIIEYHAFKGLDSLEDLFLYGNKIAALEARMFGNLPRLVYLDLVANGITSIENNPFQNLTSLMNLLLDSNKLTKLTKRMFEGLRNFIVLSVSHNEIDFIDDHTFRDFPNLTDLYLDYNKISKFTAHMIEDNPQLQYLVLDHNKIENIENCTFKDHAKITHLYISDNSISKLTPELFEGLQEIRVLKLEGNKIEAIENYTFRDLKTLEKLTLGCNKISKFTAETFTGLSQLQTLNLTKNKIQTIEKYAFNSVPKLLQLDLSHNAISILTAGLFKAVPLNYLNLEKNVIEIINNDAFKGLEQLNFLYLSDNKISKLSSGMFDDLKNLSTLELQRNKIRKIENRAFEGLGALVELNLANNWITWTSAKLLENNTRLAKLITDEYRLCCLMNVSECQPLIHTFSSCEELLNDGILRICVRSVGIVAILTNAFVIAFRTRYKTFYTNQVNSLLVKNLAISDSFMGIYLIIIAVADSVYRGQYNQHDFEWRSSTWCYVAGVMSTFSSSLTAFTLMIITVERLLVIMSPLRVRSQEIRQMVILLTIAWIAAIVIAIIPLPVFQFKYFQNFYSRSGICLPLHISSNRPNGWHYSAFVFLVLYSMAFATIVVSYAVMFWSTTKIRRAVNVANDTSLQQMVMIFRMTLFVLADATCKIPVIILGVLSLSGHIISSFVYAWIVVFVAPLNAALNPILYTVSSLPIAFKLMEYLRDHEFKSPILIQFQSPVRRKSRRQTREITLLTKVSDSGNK